MSTEDTYKYRMQVVSPTRRSESSGVGDNSPREILKKGSHKTLLKPRRSSTSSSVASASAKAGEKDLLEPMNGDGAPNHQRQTSTASRITIDSAEESST